MSFSSDSSVNYAATPNSSRKMFNENMIKAMKTFLINSIRPFLHKNVSRIFLFFCFLSSRCVHKFMIMNVH